MPHRSPLRRSSSERPRAARSQPRTVPAGDKAPCDHTRRACRVAHRRHVARHVARPACCGQPVAKSCRCGQSIPRKRPAWSPDRGEDRGVAGARTRLRPPLVAPLLALRRRRLTPETRSASPARGGPLFNRRKWSTFQPALTAAVSSGAGRCCALTGGRRASPSYPSRQSPAGVGCDHRNDHEHERPGARLRVRPFPAHQRSRLVVRPLLTSPRRAAPHDLTVPHHPTNAPRATGHLGHPWRPPRIRPTAFPAHPPRLRDGPLMDIGLRHASRLARTAAPHTRSPAPSGVDHVFLGSRFRLGLPSHPSSRSRSCLGLWLVPSTSTGDSHPRVVGHVGRTRVEARLALAPPPHHPAMRVRHRAVR